VSSRDGDKTEAPTPKRRRDGRKEGQIPKTPELGMWLQVLVASVGIPYVATRAHDNLLSVTRDIRTISVDPDPLRAVGILGKGLGLVVTTVLPLAVVMLLVGVISLLSQTGFVLATKAAKPKWSKVNPIQGVKRLFKPQGLWQGAKSTIKVTVLGAASWQPVLGITEEVLQSDDRSVLGVAGAVGASAVALARTVAMVGIVLAIADYGIQRWQVGKQLKMSKKEIRDEHKSTEGDPQVKGQIRRRQQDMSRNRMLAGVADASVVIVNPTHIAVAIRYEPGTGAPKVVAKGKGLIADRIREEAATNLVPIVRDVPLARTLEKACRVDQTIPPDLYEAVARLLAFVMQVGRRAALLGGVLDNPHAGSIPQLAGVASDQ
jgi:flagellar biosynthesis protein FlhB